MFLGLKIKLLDRAISKQFEPFGVKKVVSSDDFAYFYYKKIITYSIMEDISNKWYMDFVKKTFGYTPKDEFIFSLLHELGHHFTMDSVDLMVDAYCQDEKARIDEELKLANPYQQKAISMKYFALPDEYVATKWAVDYERNHPQKVEKMRKEIYSALNKFYKRVRLEGEC